MSEEFIEEMVNQLMDHSLTENALQEKVDNEFLRQILEETEPTELTPVC